MKGYDPKRSFDEKVASRYDAGSTRGDESATVAFLQKLASGGPALELAIGTGRIAMPLAAAGIRVDGIDFSEPMVERLRAKEGGRSANVVIGDFADVAIDGIYKLIYVVFNSFFNLLDVEDQIRCFANVAEHLTEDGTFVVEGGLTVRFIQSLTDGQYVRAEKIEVGYVGFDLLRFDQASQILYENHVYLAGDGAHFGPIAQRCTWPGELDLMARMAGMKLTERWAGWKREPFLWSSQNVISVYERA